MSTAPDVGALQLSGRVVRPGDHDYDTARTSWNHFVTRRPAAVAYVRTTQDVIDAVDWARRHQVEFRVRSGEHSLVSWSSVDDGLIIDVSGLKAATVTAPGRAPARTALLGAGLTQSEVIAALGPSGLTVPLGNKGSMGLVGATLGGGFGLLSRTFGLVSDHLLGAEIVVAGTDGRARSICVDARHHSDLLWALRGGGHGGIGIVTSLLLRTQPLSTAVRVTARWAGRRHLPAVLHAWQQVAPATDHRLTSQLEIRRDGIDLLGVMVDGSKQEALGLLAPVLGHGRPAVTVGERPWTEIHDSIQVPTGAEPANWHSTSQFVDRPVPTLAVEVVAAFLDSAPTADCCLFVQALGGAVLTGEPFGGSAFAHRDAWCYVQIDAGWGVRGERPAAEDPRTGACLDWSARFARALAPWSDGSYINVPDPDLRHWERACWGDNVDRLRAVKTAYDPQDVFHHQHSTAPLR